MNDHAPASGATYPVQTICRILDLTEQRVQQLTKAGVLVKVDRGRYDLVRSVRGYIQYLRERAMKSDAADADSGLSKKRAIEAEIAALELETMRRERLPRKEVIEVIDRVATNVRTNMMAIGPKVAPMITAKMTTAKREAVISKAISDGLNVLANLSMASGE
jgi:phage terminase Nu1 subunit (DNA packaging protein)